MARYYPKGSGGNRKPKKDDPNPILDPGVDAGRDFEYNNFSEWLYADDWTPEKLRTFEMLYSIPVVKNYADYLLDLRADNEYMNRYQLDYSDIHDPRKLRSVSSASRSFGSVLNFVSDNVKRLYR